MHEDEIVAILDGIQMDIGDAIELDGEIGQLEVMRGEQRVRAIVRGQMRRACPRQRQSVIGRRAAADFVHQHQTVLCCIVENVRRLAHFHHEGRLTARKIVAGTDAREDAVDRTDRGCIGRHETADMCEQYDQCVLSHVRRLTAHVRAGDDEHPTGRVEIQIIGFKRVLAYLFHYRMPAAHDMDALRCGQLRHLPVQPIGTFGKACEYIDIGDCGCRALQRFELRAECVEHAFVQRTLAHQ